MKTSLRSFFIAAILSVTAVCIQAAEVASEAIVLKVSGSPTASIGGQAPVALKAGDKLPVGSIITTDASSALDIKPFEGTTTTIKAGSTVKINKLSLTTEGGVITKQSALFDLSVGNIVSTLDPAKKSINDYSIKTPRGVAAARGTIYEVYVNKTTGVTIIIVREGIVTATNTNTGGSISIPAGRAVSISADGVITPLSATDARAQIASDQNEGDNTTSTTTSGSTQATPDVTLDPSPSSP